MVRVVRAVGLQLRPCPNSLAVSPIGMVNVPSSNVSCSHRHLFKAHISQLFGDAVVLVLCKTKIKVTSDEGWFVSINQRFQVLERMTFRTQLSRV